jgi:WD40 repeat protein
MPTSMAVIVIASLPGYAWGEQPVRSDQYGDPLPAGCLARLGTVRLRHADSIAMDGRVVFSPDGKLLVSGERCGPLHVWDVATGKELHRLSTEGEGIQRYAFTADSKTLVSVGQTWSQKQRVHGALARFWDMATGKEIRQIPLRESEYNGRSVDCALSADAKTAVCWVHANLGVDLWDVAAGKRLLQFPVKMGFNGGKVAFSADGRTLATLGENATTLRFWNAATGQELGTGLDKWQAENFTFSADGKMLAVYGADGVSVLEVPTGKMVRRIPAKTEFPLTAQIIFSRNGDLLAVGRSQEGDINLWAIATGKALDAWPVRLPSILPSFQDVAFSPDGTKLAALTIANVVHIWDVATAKPIPAELGGHQGNIFSVAISPDGRTVASEAVDGTNRFWESATGKEHTAQRNISRPLFTWSADGQSLRPPERELAWWETTLAAQSHRLLGKPNRGRETSGTIYQSGEDGSILSANGRVLFTRDSKLNFTAWQIATGKKLSGWTWNRDSPQAYPHAISPDGETVFSATIRGETLRLWNWRTGNDVRRWQSEGGPLSYIQKAGFSPDGRTLVTCPYEPKGLIVFWEVATGKRRGQIKHEPTFGYPVFVFSVDSRLFVLAHARGAIRVCDLAAAKEPVEFRSSGAWITALAISRDNQLVASGSADTTALIWDLGARLGEQQPKPVKLSDPEVKQLWADLAEVDGVKAFQAIRKLAGAPEQTIPLLREHLRPVPPADPRRLAQLIAELDSDRFAVRQQATAELEKLGELAEVALEKLLAGKPPLEVSQRVEPLVAKLQAQRRDMPPEQVRLLRAIETLEQIGTAEARELLEKLATGGTRLSLEAKVTLGRWRQQ